MHKYVNFKIATDSVSVNIYIETGGEPIHVVYWMEDEWMEDAETVVPAIIKAIDLYYTDPMELIERVLNPNMPDPRGFLITSEELSKFRKDWGQTEKEICFELEIEEEGSESVLTDDYFWDEEAELWCNKGASGFEGKDQMIADYLRNL